MLNTLLALKQNIFNIKTKSQYFYGNCLPETVT